MDDVTVPNNNTLPERSGGTNGAGRPIRLAGSVRNGAAGPSAPPAAGSRGASPEPAGDPDADGPDRPRPTNPR
ncbi:MAG TPA: hypothetical protein VNA11_12270, partial [Pseudonocardia sp.]|nr:hypothetical protein [Pseudonocardia sp.]